MSDRQKKTPGTLGTLVVGMMVLAGVFVLNNRYPSLLALAQLKAFDLRMYARGTHKPQGEVAIVAVDDKSITELGRWPWPRSVLAQLTTALKDYRVAVVGFDLVFSEPDGEPRDGAGGNDQAFAAAIKRQGATFIGYALQMQRSGSEKITAGFTTKVTAPGPSVYGQVLLPDGILAPPIPEAIAYLPNLPAISAAARGTGYLDTPADADGVFRSEMMAVRFGKLYCEPLIVAVTSAYADNARTSVSLSDYGVAGISIGPLSVPVDEQGRMLVNFRGPSHTFPYYSASDVIAHRVPPRALAKKIVLVGAVAVGVGDRWSTPVGSDFPGVEIHANAIDNILTGDFIQRSQVTAGVERMGAIVLAVAVTAAVAFLSASWAAIATLALIVGYFALAQYSADHTRSTGRRAVSDNNGGSGLRRRGRLVDLKAHLSPRHRE